MVLAVAIACYELSTSLATQRIDVPVIPLMAGSAIMVIAAYADGTDALAVALALTIVAVIASRIAVPSSGRLKRDLVVGVFVVVYVPLLAAFAMVMVTSGRWRRPVSGIHPRSRAQRHRWVRIGGSLWSPSNVTDRQSQEIVGGLCRDRCSLA